MATTKTRTRNRNSSRRVDKTTKKSVKQKVSSTHKTNIPFPIDALPTVVRRFVRESSESIGCDPSYVALPLLATLARLISNKRELRIKSDWIEPAVIWAVIIGESGHQKTPGQDAAISFLVDAEKSQSTNPITYTSSDISFAGLRDLLEKNPDNSLLDMPDELVEVLHSFGSRGQGTMKKGHWLTCWKASSPLTVHRYKHSVVIPRPAVSIIGGIQPNTFRDVVVKERHVQDGLCARFLVAWPPQTKPVQWSHKQRSLGSWLDMSCVFEKLIDLSVAFDLDGSYKPHAIRLSDEAQKMFISFHDRLNKQAYRQDHDLKAAWLKLVAYAARLALILQLVSWASKSSSDKDGTRIKVSSLNLQRAIQLTEWFQQESKRVYALLSETSEDRERRDLVDLIRRHDGSITPSLLMKRSRKYNTSEKATAALSDLVKQTLVIRDPATSGPKGGRPKCVYRLIDTA